MLVLSVQTCRVKISIAHLRIQMRQFRRQEAYVQNPDSHRYARRYAICTCAVAQRGCFWVTLLVHNLTFPVKKQPDSRHSAKQIFTNHDSGSYVGRFYLAVWRSDCTPFLFQFIMLKPKHFILALQHHLNWRWFWSNSLWTANVNLIPHIAFKNHWQQDPSSDVEIDFPTDWFHPGSSTDLQSKKQ